MARDRDEDSVYDSSNRGRPPAPSDPGHSRLPPSGAARWTVCTASVGFIERHKHELPKDTSIYADEGTKAHERAKGILLGTMRIQPTDDVDMMLNVRNYVDYVHSKVREGDRVDTEKKVSLFYLPDQYGTVDRRHYNGKRVAIIDLKYGVGVGVYAEQNKQLAIYAESAIQELELAGSLPDDLPVELCIYQPRDRNDSTAEREWHLTRGQLRAFTKPIEAVAREILGNPDGGKFAPSDETCQFCRAKAICKAYAARGLAAVTTESVDVVLAKPLMNLPDPAALTREQRVQVLASSDVLSAWVKSVEELELADLMAGKPAMGYKVVEGKSNRKWGDETAATVLLSSKGALDAVAPRSVVSPAQAEKLFKTDKAFVAEFGKLVVKPPGKPTLAPESDKRPAFQINPNEGLEDIDLV